MSAIARITAGLIGLFAIGSIGLDMWITLSANPDRTVLGELWRLLRYFTILTNLMLAGLCFWVASGRRVAPFWTAAVALWIAIVGIVYHLLLARDLSGIEWWPDFGLHTFVPVAYVLWWLAYAPKTGLRFIDGVSWLGWPALYVVYALGRGTLDGVYPYFFLNPVKSGWLGVAGWSVGLCSAFFVGGIALIAVAKGITKVRPHPADVALRDPQLR